MNFSQIISQPGTAILADGAWGTQLSACGLSGGVPDTWSLSHPEAVANVAACYAAAGARIVLTNTFGASPVKLAKAGVSDWAEINRRGVQLSRHAVPADVLVFGSIGPTGELVGLTSTLTEEDLEDTFRQQVSAMLEAGPDGFVLETFADLTEIRAALRAIRSLCVLPVAACLTYDDGVRGPATMMGVRPDIAAETLAEEGATLVGANCGRLSNQGWKTVVEATVAATHLPVWAKFNAGIPELIDGESVFPMSPDAFADLGLELVAAGARVVGGCCGTTPDHIAALSARLV